MAGKTLTIQEAIELSGKLHNEGKKIVLVGGCFDILHIGHIEFLKKAKEKGDILFVLLESDSNIKKLKGKKRPINTQVDRAIVLKNLEMVDYVVMLEDFRSDSEYDNLVISLKPAIIAITKADPGRFHKDRQAKLIDADVIEVTDPISNQSTTKLIDVLREI